MIQKYLLKKAQDLAFINIKHDGEFKIEGYNIPQGGLEVPIKNEVLVKGIKENTAQDSLNTMSIADAMIYIIVIDKNFRYNDEYKKFLDAFSKKVNLDLKSYMGYMSKKYFDIGEYKDSLIYLSSFIEFYPNDVEGLYHYSIVCQEIANNYKKDNDKKAMNDFLVEALKKLEIIIDLDEEFALAYYQLGYHYYNQGQYIKSKVMWEEGIRLGLDSDLVSELQDNIGKMDYKVQYEEGYSLIFKGRNEEALEKLLPLEEEHVDWWNLLFMIGLAYKNMNEIEEAKKYFNKILIIKPHQVDTLVELGLCEACLYNLDKSIEYFETAVKIKEDPEILCNLGMAYLNKGEIDDAIYHIERAYELNPQDEITIACLNEIEKYR